MRRFLGGIALFCMVCGFGLLWVGGRNGAEREVTFPTGDGRTLEVRLFSPRGTGIGFGGGTVVGEEASSDGIMDSAGEDASVETVVDTSVSFDAEGGWDSLDVYAALGTVTIQTGEAWAVELGDSPDGTWDGDGDTLTVDAGIGDVTITVPEDLELRELDLEADQGSVTLRGVKARDLIIRQGGGELSMEDCTWESADLSNDAGRVSGTGLTSGELTVTASLGEVDLAGQLRGKTEIEADMGSVTLRLTDSRERYSGTLEADLGMVEAGGWSGRQVELTGGPDQLEVYCDLGGITVRFDQ